MLKFIVIIRYYNALSESHQFPDDHPLQLSWDPLMPLVLPLGFLWTKMIGLMMGAIHLPLHPIESQERSGNLIFSTDNSPIPLQNGHQILDDWLPHRDQYLSTILSNNSRRSSICESCHASEALYQCQHCFASPQLCSGCILVAHRSAPFHHIQKWNGHFFQPVTLMALGYFISLGHHGQSCPHGSIAPRETVLCVVDTNGVTHHRFKICQCMDAKPFHLQLLDMQLFPATMNRPETVFTFSVLDRFHIESLECKISANNFYNQLRRLTNSRFPHHVPVSCPLLSLV